jgi:hypothetical protein
LLLNERRPPIGTTWCAVPTGLAWRAGSWQFRRQSPKTLKMLTLFPKEFAKALNMISA